jgi:cell division protein FtsB
VATDIVIEHKPAGGEYFFNTTSMKWVRDSRSATPVKSGRRARPSRRDNDMKQDSQGFSWSVKELVPLLITIMAFLASGVGVYTKLSSDIIVAQQEIMHIKNAQSEVATQLQAISKSNENIKTQIEDLRISIMVMMKQGK